MGRKAKAKKARAKAKAKAKSAAQSNKPAFRAAYNAARPTADNLKQFLSARHETTLQAQSRSTRDSLRTQARQELGTNQHAGGIARLFGLYVVGTGPRLKFKGFPKYERKAISRDLVDFVNYKWERFADDIQFATTLRNAMEMLVVDGDAFLFFGFNPKKQLGLDLKLLDSQRIGNPDGKPSSRSLQDGIFLDAWGNPTDYCVYDVPDMEGAYYSTSSYQTISSNQIFHLFRSDLPGQTRGISWFASALPLLQQLREYTAAVVESAKQGARFVATIETQQGFSLDDFNDVYALPSDMSSSDSSSSATAENYTAIPYDAWGTFHTKNGDSLVLPPGTTQKGFNPSQPTAEASSYTANILSQIGYSMGLPRNKATGSSHEYNFASGRLDNQPFEMLIKTLQLDLFERKCCDRLFKYFYEALEPELLERFDADETPTPDETEWEWVWPTPPLVDAEATARTNAIKLQSLQATLGEVWNETHPFSEFEDVRNQFKLDEADFPKVFGLQENDLDKAPAENTKIGEPLAPPVRRESV